MFNAIQDILLQQVPLVMVTLCHTKEGTLKSPHRAQYKEASLGPDSFLSSLTINPTLSPPVLSWRAETHEAPTTKCCLNVVTLIPPT